MTELQAETHESSMSVLPTKLAAPRLYLSSAHAGWKGLSARAFHEPCAIESWRIPATPHITLELFTGGAMHIERREAQGSWKGSDMHDGDLFLNWGGGPSYEARWWSLSAVPTQTLDLQVSRELVDRVAQEVGGVDLDGLHLVGQTSFTDPLLAQIALTLRRELEQPAPAGDLYAQTAAQLIAVHLVRQHISSSHRLKALPLPPTGLSDRQVQRVQEFIQAHLDEQLSLETLAEQVGFSSHHFAQLFRRATGVSPHQFVLRQRIERAQRLLEETDLPLAEVASACGFTHQSHLTQVFKHQLGRTPRAYRREDSRSAGF